MPQGNGCSLQPGPMATWRFTACLAVPELGGSCQQWEGQAAKVFQQPLQNPPAALCCSRLDNTHRGQICFLQKGGILSREAPFSKNPPTPMEKFSLHGQQPGDQQPPQLSARSPRPCHNLCQKQVTALKPAKPPTGRKPAAFFSTD